MMPSQTYTINIHQLTLDWNIGVYDDEYEKPQPLIIDLSLTLTIPEYERQTYEYKNMLCYDRLSQELADMSRQDHVELLESLAVQILDHCLAKPMVQKAWVRLTKPEALKATPVLKDAYISIEMVKEHEPH